MLSFLAGRINTQIIGKTIKVYQSLPSTMDKARDEALKNDSEGLVVVALEQTEGRGRMGRKWITGEGGLAVSVLLKPDIRPLYELTMLGGLAILRTCKALGVTGAGIKWPNDVLVSDKKAAGVLVECRTGEGGYCIVGMGINVNQLPELLPNMPVEPTSLSLELGKTINMAECLGLLLKFADELYVDISTGGSLFEEWRQNLVTLGHKVSINTLNGERQGMAIDVNPHGSLVIKSPEGELITITAGDVNLKP